MRAVVSTLIAVSVLGLVALPASAFDPRSFCERQDRHSR